MKSANLFLASLLVMSLSAVPIHAQTAVTLPTGPDNAMPAPCCNCVGLAVYGQSYDPDAQTKKLKPNPDGSYRAVVLAAFVDNNPPPGTKCKNDYKITIAATIQDGQMPVYIESKSIDMTKPNKAIEFTVPADIARWGDNWNFSLRCEGLGAHQGINVDGDLLGMNKGCSSVSVLLGGCEGCEWGKCGLSGMPDSSNGSFSVSIPTSTSLGGMAEGFIEFHAKDFSNPGRKALFTNIPNNFIETRNADGILTSVDTGNGMVIITPADAELLLKDSNAFNLIHKDKNGIVFRITTISFINEDDKYRLRMDTTYEGTSIRHEQTHPSPECYILEKGSVIQDEFHSLTREELIKTESVIGKRINRSVSHERNDYNALWAKTRDVETTWEYQVNGWVKTKEVIDPDGAALTSNWVYYQPGEITGANGATQGLGRLKHQMRHDGYEAFYSYSLHQTTITTPYAGNPTGQVETKTWDPVTKTTMIITTVGGQIKSKNTTTHSDTTQTNVVYTSSTSTLTTVTHYIPSGQDFGGKPTRVSWPDGTITTYAYTRNTGGGFTTVVEKGSTNNGASVAKGTRTIIINNAHGTTILQKAEAIGYDAGTASFGSMAVTSVDNLGRALTTAHHPTSASVTGEVASATGAAWTTTTVYSCCGIAKETDMYGIPTFRAYDQLQRPIKTNRLGVTTETFRKGALDNDGKPLVLTETHRYPESVEESLSPSSNASAANLVSRSVSNLAGTIQESWSPDPTPDVRPDPINDPPRPLIKSAATVTTYKPATGLSTRTVITTPDNFSQTTDSFLDGCTASISGALSPAIVYNYSVNSTGDVTSQTYVDGANLRETTTTQSDWAGRPLSTTYMDGAVSTMTYNSIGQMVKSTDPDGVTTLTAYNAEGERVLSATDLNSNNAIDYGVDTVSYSDIEYVVDTLLAETGSEPAMKSITKVWQPGDTNPAGGTIVSTSLRSANGLRESSQTLGVSYPALSKTVLSGNGNSTMTQTNPDGTYTVSTTTAGLVVSTVSYGSNNQPIQSASIGYDSLNRPVTNTDSRTGATTTTYLSATADVVVSTTDPGNRTTSFGYDIRGRRISTTLPDNTVTTTTYTPRGEIASQDGSQTYPVTYTYDYAGRQKTMTTSGTESATTTWHYSPTRGFLNRKAYNDGNGTDYTYTAAGRLSTRGWARAVGTSYAYDAGGRLISTTYSDDTPDVSVSYDSLGRQTSQSNGVATITYTYDPATLALDTETIAYNLDGNPGADFTRVLDHSSDNLGRDTGWTLGVPASAGLDNQATYTYGTTDGRINSVSGGGLQPPSQFNYSYVSNSNLLATITGPTHTVTNTWAADLDVLDLKENKVGTTLISSYDYSVNSSGQRSNVIQTGTAFAAPRAIAWGYDQYGQVITADSDNSSDDRAYQYDAIGNRLKSADSLTLPTTNNYTPNALNQYAAVNTLNPGYDLDGNMTSGPLAAAPSANSTLVWDGENRLVSTTVNGTTTTYQYDSQSRRISSSVGVSPPTLFVYDGWNVIVEYSIIINQYTISKSYIWGIDLSSAANGSPGGARQGGAGAGGVGGLLAVTDTTGSYFPTYDGNGNISEYLDTTGSIAAHYEYDPFGRETVSNETNLVGFSHRFSTKLLDITTGLLYFGCRYYNPIAGRWPSRDPIEEEGGVNLYGYLNNSATNKIDYIGLWFADGTPFNEQVLKSAASVVLDGNGRTKARYLEETFKNNKILIQAAVNHEDRHGQSALSIVGYALPYKQVFCVEENAAKSYYFYGVYGNKGSKKYDRWKFNKAGNEKLLWDYDTWIFNNDEPERMREEIRETNSEIVELRPFNNFRNPQVQDRIEHLTKVVKGYESNKSTIEHDFWIRLKLSYQTEARNYSQFKHYWPEPEKIYQQIINPSAL